MEPIMPIKLSNEQQIDFFKEILDKHPDLFFVYDVDNKKFTYTNKALRLKLQIADADTSANHCEKLQQLLHPEDQQSINNFLNQLIANKQTDAFTLDFRLIQAGGDYAAYKIKMNVLQRNQEGFISLLVGTAADYVPGKQNENTVNRESMRLGELSFLASQELGQEYAKIQSIIQLLDNKFITENERNDLINEAKKSIQIINSSIFKINHKLSFNQTAEFVEPGNEKKTYKRILLIDDDVLTNVLNKKLINTVVPDKPLHIFLNIDDALNYLRDRDTEGDHLIFLDINFPDRNGWDFLDEYNNFGTKSKVVVLSSSIDNRDREKARSYEIVIDYITKPLSMEFIKNLFE